MCKLFHTARGSELWGLWFLLETKQDVRFCDVMNTCLLYFETFAKLLIIIINQYITLKMLKDCLALEEDYISKF